MTPRTLRITRWTLVALALVVPPGGRAFADEDAVPTPVDESRAAEPAADRLQPLETPLDGPSLAIAGQFFGGYASELGQDAPPDAWTLDRADLGLTWTQPFRLRTSGTDMLAGGELSLEAFRSTEPGAVQGDGNGSILLRARRAWVFSESDHGRLTSGAGVGLVPDAWIHTLDARYDLRSMAPTLGERGGFYDTSDLGALLWFDFAERVRLDVGFTNGEGRAGGEQNDGKNLTAVLTGVPLALDVHRGPLSIAVHAAYRDGSIGAAGVRDHRISGGLTFVGPCPRAGFEMHRAIGYLGRADVIAQGFGVWANSYLGTPWVAVAVRYDQLQSDVDVADSVARRTTLALYSGDFGVNDRTNRVTTRMYVGVELDRYDDGATPFAGAAEAVDTERFFVRFAFDGHRLFEFQ